MYWHWAISPQCMCSLYHVFSYLCNWWVFVLVMISFKQLHVNVNSLNSIILLSGFRNFVSTIWLCLFLEHWPSLGFFYLQEYMWCGMFFFVNIPKCSFVYLFDVDMLLYCIHLCEIEIAGQFLDNCETNSTILIINNVNYR